MWDVNSSILSRKELLHIAAQWNVKVTLLDWIFTWRLEQKILRAIRHNRDRCTNLYKGELWQKIL